MSTVADVPRVVLKWLQGLDLSYSIKNIRRDFSNAFLVAEIFSRYYPGDIQMHSYSNGAGMESRNKNWKLLQRFLRKIDFEMSPELIASMVHCDGPTTVAFLESLYEKLTQRKIKKTNVERSEEIPPFARQTASLVIRNTLRRPDMLELGDIRQKQRIVSEVLTQYQHQLKVERTSGERAKYISSIRDKSTLTSDEQSMFESRREIGNQSEESKQGQNVQHIQVKNLDNNTTHKTRRGMQSKPDVKGGSAIKFFDMLNKAVLNNLANTAFAHLIGSTEDELDATPLIRLMNALVDPHIEIPDEISATVFDEICQNLVEDKWEQSIVSVLTNKKHFWTLSSILCPLLVEVPEATDTFELVKEAFARIGAVCVRHDSSMSMSVFMELVLPKLLPLVQRDPGKRHAILSLLYTFCDNNAKSHVKIIKALHEMVGELPSFLHCLTILIFLETDFSGPQGDTLLDLYVYYSVIGMGMTSPSLRAASIAMLAVVAQHSFSLVAQMISYLEDAATDPWWEVQAQLLVVGSKLLDECLRDGGREDARIENLVLSVFRTDAASNTRKLGLVYLSRQILRLPAVAERYFQILINMLQEHFDASLTIDTFNLLNLANEPEELPIASSSGGVYRLYPLPFCWDAAVVAALAFQHAKMKGLQSLTHAHLEIINRAVQSAGDGMATDSKWEEMFYQFKDYIFVALVDPQGCSYAVDLLISFLMDTKVGTRLFTIRSFELALKALFSQTQGRMLVCQDLVVTFLRNCLTTQDSEVVAHGTAVFVKEFTSRYPDLLQSCVALRNLESEAAQAPPTPAAP